MRTAHSLMRATACYADLNFLVIMTNLSNIKQGLIIMIDDKKMEEAENQVYELRKTVRYDIRDLTVEQIVNKFDKSLSDDFDEESDTSTLGIIYIPEYQRDFTWDENRQAKLIESIILGLPIPFIFVAENRYGNWEIVDGSQRIRTLHAFLKNNLKLKNLETLDKINDFKFIDLANTRQAKIKDTALRLIVLSEETTDEVKKDMFERINKGSDLLKPMENRKGSYSGKFTSFIYQIAQNENVRQMIPLGGWSEKRQEREELILRFFGLLENYPEGINDVGIAKYLDTYLQNKNENFKEEEIAENTRILNAVITIANRFFPYSFRLNNYSHTKRSVFEAISVGIAIFLRGFNGNINEIQLNKEKIMNGLLSPEFITFTKGGSLHKKAKLIGRIDFIKNLLNQSIIK